MDLPPDTTPPPHEPDQVAALAAVGAAIDRFLEDRLAEAGSVLTDQERARSAAVPTCRPGARHDRCLRASGAVRTVGHEHPHLVIHLWVKSRGPRV